MSQPLERIQRFGIAAWSILGGVGLLAVLAWLIVKVRIIWPPVVFSVAIVYLLNPLVGRLQRWGLHRLLGSCLSYLILAGVLTAVGFLVVPVVREQAVALADEVPQVVDDAIGFAQDLANRVGLELEMPAFETIQEWFSQPENQDRIREIATGIFDVAANVVEAVLLLVLAPVLAFYLLIDSSNSLRVARSLLPESARDEIVFVSRQVGRALGGFVRGQLLVALIVGVLSSLALWIIGLPLWLIIGMVAGLLNLVPFIGPWVGGFLAVIVALALGDWRMALWAALAMAIVQQIDNHFISPTVLRATVKLHPVAIILALLIGGSLAGFLGILIAVPITAIIKIVASHLWRTRALDQSWEEASEAIIHEYEPVTAEMILGRFQRIRDIQVSRGAVAHPDLDLEGHVPPEEGAGE